MTTYQQAQDQILGVFSKAWTTTGYEAVYPNIQKTRNKTNNVYASVFINHVEGGQRTLGSPASFERIGFVTVQIYVPCGKGLQEVYRCAKIISDAYEGKSTEGGIWFRNVRVNEVGEDNGVYQVNVIIDFTYDEVKEI